MFSDRQNGPTVGLDGTAVRRIREGKGLTQLYVAEVVGVSVDTVSRWENNRTSAVKRENAEALAGALEVVLSEILRSPEPEAVIEEPTPRRRTSARVWCLGAAALLALAAGAALLFLLGGPALSVEAERALPAYLAPGNSAPVLVRIRVLSGAGRRVVLRERLPHGWRLERSTLPPDAGPGPDGLVRWIVPMTGRETMVAYVVRAPEDAPVGSTGQFEGELAFPGPRGGGAGIDGDQRTEVELVYWADQNGDYHLSDGELLEALERLEAVKALNPDSSDLRPLWGAGEYTWDEGKKSFRPKTK